MTAKCPWCGRENVEITDKGGLGNHTNPGGARCFAVGMKVGEDKRTPPRPFKGTVQRNSHRRKREG